MTSHCFEKLHVNLALTPAPVPAPAPVQPQPPSLERPAPAQIVAGVQRSNWQCQQTDWNWDYQLTVNKDATQKAQHHGRLQQPEPSVGTPETLEFLEEIPEFPGAFAASTESLWDFIFAGTANSESDLSLPGTTQCSHVIMMVMDGLL
ncbi:hypothetical protein PAXRUDRAFT_147889 [Paxillus rubicundulus Ve08.2h10]|uniref:Uncharacterized protein n=1 Tax=Paxillus rubicundulus Ve08.2h10 TaxID=930991 RepID=A0A0D0DZ57_9AGAM|nr:hypothetical protein PAXRUDRAFT_147889 [Paxillus rubicundulus Ve08.2h10]